MATMVSNAAFSAPSRRIWYSSSAAMADSRAPGRMDRVAFSNASELVSTLRRMRAISSSDFTIRSLSTTGPIGLSVTPRGSDFAIR